MDRHIQRPDFFDAVEQGFKCRDTVSGVRDLFNRHHLPEPKAGEFFHTADDGYIIPLDDYGLMFRIESFHGMKQPHILDPIDGKYISGTQFGLYAGVNDIGIDKNDFNRIKNSLRGDNIYSMAGQADDCGYIGPPTKAFPHGFPVILDIGDTNSLLPFNKTDSIGTLFRNFYIKMNGHNPWSDDIPDSPQKEFFKPLRTLAQKAANDNTSQAVKGFWQRCREEYIAGADKNISMLRSSWQTANEAQTKGKAIAAIGKRYAQRLRQDPFHKAIIG